MIARNGGIIARIRRLLHRFTISADWWLYCPEFYCFEKFRTSTGRFFGYQEADTGVKRVRALMQVWYGRLERALGV
jgi:hypothetical protein